MKLDRICSFCHWKNPSPSFLAGISKICLWNWIIHKKRRDLCQTTFVNTRIYIYISNCVSKCFQIMKTLNNTHTPPPLDPLITWWMPTLNPLQNTIPNPHKTDPTGESMELKARCHSSPFTKAFIVELKVMMSSLEPLEIDPNRPFLPSWKWKNTPPKRKEKGPIFHFHELWEGSFDTMFFFRWERMCFVGGSEKNHGNTQKRGTDHISHPRGTSENHGLKRAGW